MLGAGSHMGGSEDEEEEGRWNNSIKLVSEMPMEAYSELSKAGLPGWG